VLEALREVCLHHGWTLLAAHVRSNHVHVVTQAEVQPEKVMNDFKSYASRSLNRLGRDGSDRKRCARHGSTRWLWKDKDVQDAIRYVVEEQGEPMAVFVADEF
jgi:REP element-mobilizing transposase RayT